MRFLTARRLALVALIPALLIFTVIPGCSNESEGERCGDDFGGINNDDCASGLVCIPSAMLLNSDGADRCCHAEAIDVTDSRCTRTSDVSTGGASGTNDAGAGTGGTAGSPDAAASTDAAAAGAGDN